MLPVKSKTLPTSWELLFLVWERPFKPLPKERAALVGSRFQTLVNNAAEQDLALTERIAGILLVSACRLSRQEVVGGVGAGMV